MAMPKSLIEESRLARETGVPSPYIFEKTIGWEGVKVGHYRVRPGEMSAHVHRNHHVFVPLDGSITIEDESKNGTTMIRRRKVGDISVTPAGASYSASWQEELEYVLVFLSQDFIGRATIDFEANKNAKIVLACGPQDALIRSIGQALAAEVDSGQPTGRLYAESLVNTLAVHLLRHYSTDSVVPDLHFGGLPVHKLRRVRDFIDENLEGDLSLVEIAQAADLSPYHFARSFKQTTGLTPIQFLMQRRIDYAKRLLIESELPIVEVGLSAGFKNQSHFTTLFRKLTAMTPRAYRKARLR
ncbi:MAG: AraC family transcriptional regulator [Acidobacteria bacterium]|nr:AraC family transcriptional regulator [Acidobacteriota bacterium]